VLEMEQGDRIWLLPDDLGTRPELPLSTCS
jgi:hypothetical protein